MTYHGDESRPKSVRELWDVMCRIEAELAGCLGDDDRHSRLSDELCRARRDWRQATGVSPFYDAGPGPGPRNPRIP